MITALEITDSGVVYEKDGAVHTAPGTAFYAIGMRADEAAYLALYNKAPHVAFVGDCKRVGKVDGAIQGGYFAALDA